MWPDKFLPGESHDSEGLGGVFGWQRAGLHQFQLRRCRVITDRSIVNDFRSCSWPA